MSAPEQDLYSQQLLPTINPQTKAVTGHKLRAHVHQEGDWHPAVQAFVTCRNQDQLQVLLQKRSSRVDVSKNSFDQSLAVQVIKEDAGDPEAALRRGLMNELGLDLDQCEFRRVAAGVSLNIVKRYESDARFYNREILYLYLVHCDCTSDLNPDERKITQLEWIPFEDFASRLRANIDVFTKTSRFYVVDELLSNLIRHDLQLLTEIDLEQPPGVVEGELPGKIVYLSDRQSDFDYSLHQMQDGKIVLYKYDLSNAGLRVGTQNLKGVELPTSFDELSLLLGTGNR